MHIRIGILGIRVSHILEAIVETERMLFGDFDIRANGIADFLDSHTVIELHISVGSEHSTLLVPFHLQTGAELMLAF